MESANVFDLQEAIDNWLKTNTDHLNLTDDDKEEILDHFRSTVNELQKLDLSDEEAFAVAKIRFGGAENWGDDFKKVSLDNLQVKKVLTFFFGIMVYFILYLAILFLINSVCIALYHFGENTVAFNQKTVKLIYYVVYIAIPLIMFSLFRFRYRLLASLKRKNLSFGKLLWTFVFLVVALLGERITYPLVKIVVKPYENWQFILSNHRMLQRDFQFYFPIIIVVSFIFLFLLYRKKNYV